MRAIRIVSLVCALVLVAACPDRQSKCERARAVIKNDQAKIDTMTRDGLTAEEAAAVAALVKNVADAEVIVTEQCSGQVGDDLTSWLQ